MTTDQKAFQEKVWDYYYTNKRDMPWRNLPEDPEQRFYEVMISEVMLQQTQVARVKTKFAEWMTALPTLNNAQQASSGDVLRLWSGLGYNRRAVWLYDALKASDSKKLPITVSELVVLKGFGSNTAASILVYAHNKPIVFIETNIRTVYLHEFFSGVEKVTDREISTLVASTLDQENPREWYWALMDYGAFLKSEGFTNKTSATYTRQPTFQGSFRQLRAKILKYVLQSTRVDHQELRDYVCDGRLDKALDSLEKDKLIHKNKDVYSA